MDSVHCGHPSTRKNKNKGILMMSENVNTRWEALRRETKSLENVIDSKLAQLSGKAANAFGNGSGNESSSTSASRDILQTEVDQLEKSIDDDIKRLNRLVDQMNDLLASPSNTNNNNLISGNIPGGGQASMFHMLQRHRDILFDYGQEFRRIKENIKMKREQSQLLFNVKQDIHEFKSVHGLSDTEILLNERSHLDQSHLMADSILEQAFDTRANLQHQRGTLQSSSRRTNSLTSRFPLINSIMRKIQFKKRKDTIILATVSAVCIVLILIYKFS